MNQRIEPEPFEPALDEWQRRFTADPARAQEAAEVYAGMGWAVLLVAATPSDLASRCGGCRTPVLHSWVVLYTRRKSDESLPQRPQGFPV